MQEKRTFIIFKEQNPAWLVYRYLYSEFYYIRIFDFSLAVKKMTICND